MHQLERLVLCNWGRLAPQDIPIRGVTAILGPTGAGKSTIVDAIQLIVTGSSSRYYDLNKSTGGRNQRTIAQYCLGADDHVDPDAPAREAADSLLAMVFRDQTTGKPISIGLVYSADRAETQAQVRARFVARNYALSIDDVVEVRAPGKWLLPRATPLIDRIKQLCPDLRLHASGRAYVNDYLYAMRSRGSPPDGDQVLRNFKESIAFQPIDDPTEFVRRHILEEENIDVEALKGSIERYRFFEAEVKRREQQLEQIAGARQRMQVWGQYQVRHNIQLFIAAYAERRRLTLVIEQREAERRALAEDLAREERIKASHLRSIQEIEADILRTRRLMAEAPEAIQLHGLEMELETARVKASEAVGAAGRRIALLSRLRPLLEHANRIPLSLADAVKAVAELIATARTRSGEALLAADDELVVLERRVLRLAEADDHFARQLIDLDRQVAEERGRLDELEGRLRGATTGQMLSSQVTEFKRLLAAQGIDARPLPDLVEVSDASWAMALEMLLGPHREALLVPRERVGDAFRLLYENRRGLHQCRLVDLRKTGRWTSRLAADSIARLIVTDDEDARVFIERQIGRYAMAESDADLEHLEQAVTRRGKTTAGMSLRVYRDIEPILGKTAQQRALEAARVEFDQLSALHRNTRAARDALNAARSVFVELRDTPADDLAQALERLADAAAKLRGASQAREQLASPQAKSFSDEIAAFQAEIGRYREEIDEEIEPRIKTLAQQDIKLQVELKLAAGEVHQNRTKEAAAQAREAADPIAQLLQVLPAEETLEQARARVEVAAWHAPGQDPAAVLADLSIQATQEAEPMQRLAADSLRRGRSAFQTFVHEHLGQAPLQNTDDDVAILRWCMERERRLEEDELRRYREEFEQARRQMESDLTEGLIHRLSDKFHKAKQQIDRLNRSLSGRTFTGQTYSFRQSLNEALKPIHALAQAIAQEPRKGLAVLEDDTLDPRVRAGFRDLERRLANDDLVKDLRDYRRFFDFDLHMRNERGQETTLSKRSVTGSGGQKQAPYYVAVGAAMASAYYPKSATETPDGFGLVVFDEAFNNLDAPNTRALLDFFGDLHLQVLVAAPDKVRAMFLESADTIVSVNRRPDTQEPVVTVTHPSFRAHQALAAINPVNLGVEHFRESNRSAAE